jgi:hypothetical protein
MTFTGIDNQTVELKVINYQYPEITNGDWDSNWLNIYIKVISKLGHWETVDPSLTTWDLKRLIHWFDNLSNNIRPEYIDICFLEPNISFELTNNFDSEIKTIKIKFDLEFRPQSAVDDIEYFVAFTADNNLIKSLTSDLNKELEKYPERKPTHNSRFKKLRAKCSHFLHLFLPNLVRADKGSASNSANS